MEVLIPAGYVTPEQYVRLTGARSIPWASLLFALGAFVVAATSSERALEFDRSAVAAGAVWRGLTSHWTHFGADHMAWDVATFAVLAALTERRDRIATLLIIVSSAALIPTAIWWAAPDVLHYRGLSGIDSALFGLLMVQMLAACGPQQTRLKAVLWSSLVAFAAKSGFEYGTGATLFADCRAAGFEPVVLAHLVGGIAGVSIGLARGAVHRSLCAKGAGPLRHRQPRLSFATIKISANDRRILELVPRYPQPLRSFEFLLARAIRVLASRPLLGGASDVPALVASFMTSREACMRKANCMAAFVAAALCVAPASSCSR